MDTPFIYLDYNASTPIDSRVTGAMIPYLTNHYGNPSSIHLQGKRAKEAIETARRQLADLLGASPGEIIFTSGGTESNNLAIMGTAMAQKDKGNHIITSDIEHPAVLEVCKYLEKQGFDITYLKANQKGIVDPKDLERAITPRTILITIMHANNEIGSVQPIPEIGEIAERYAICLHTDAAQSIGKIRTQVNDLKVDLLSVAGHKFYAPKGVGALYVKKGTPIVRTTFGAGHEFNLRPGTENTLLIVGLGKAAEIAHLELERDNAHLREMRDYLLQRIKALKMDGLVNGDLSLCLPNTLNISFKDIDANAVIHALRDTVALSAGSACHSGKVTLSNVVKATLKDYGYAKGTFRFSVGRNTTKKDIDSALAHLFKSFGNGDVLYII
ncbi:MAG: cysteine desulfurase family protein [Flavobacteriaceae bacterium]